MKLLTRLSDTWAKRILIGWIIILSILYATMSVVRHNHFQSGGFDLGLYDQEIWQYSHFLSPYNTVKDRFILGDHLTLTLPLLAPVFWFVNDVRALLVVQAVWVSVSVFAVYLLVRTRKFSPYAALGLSFVYSLFYGIQYGIFFDFHPVLLATGLIPWMLYFMETGRTKLFITSVILLLLTQENMGIALISLGFIYVWKKEYRRRSIWFFVIGIVFSYLAVKTIDLFYPFQYSPQISLNPLDFFNAPEKQQVWLYTLSAFSFLPLFSPGALMAVGFDLAQYFVTGPNFARMWSPFMHHRAILAPYVLLGTLDAFAFLSKRKINITVVTTILVISMLLQQFIFHYPLNKLTKKDFWQVDSWMTDNEAMITSIPSDMRLATQQSLVPHLTHRSYIYIAWPRVHDFKQKPCGAVSCWWLDTDSHAAYLLIDNHPGVWITMTLETHDHIAEAISNMEKLGKITLVRKINDIALYKINN